MPKRARKIDGRRKTSIYIDGKLWDLATAYARLNKKYIYEILEEALIEYLERRGIKIGEKIVLEISK